MSDELTTIQRVALDQEEPEWFLDDLREVRDNMSEKPREFQRFKLELELGADDLDQAICEVEEVVDE